MQNVHTSQNAQAEKEVSTVNADELEVRSLRKLIIKSTLKPINDPRGVIELGNSVSLATHVARMP